MLLPRLFFQQLSTKSSENIHTENSSSLYGNRALLSGQLVSHTASQLWEGKLLWSSLFPLAHVVAQCISHLAYGRLSLLGVMAKVLLNSSISAVTTKRRKPRSHRKHIIGLDTCGLTGIETAERGRHLTLLHDKDVPSLWFTFLLTTVQRNDVTVLMGQYYTLSRTFLPQPRVSLLILLYIFTLLLGNGIILSIF